MCYKLVRCFSYQQEDSASPPTVDGPCVGLKVWIIALAAVRPEWVTQGTTALHGSAGWGDTSQTRAATVTGLVTIHKEPLSSSANKIRVREWCAKQGVVCRGASCVQSKELCAEQGVVCRAGRVQSRKQVC